MSTEPSDVRKTSKQRHTKKVIGRALALLDSNEANLSQSALALNLPKSTLYDWRKRYANDPDVEHYRQLKNSELADRFRVISAKASERLIAEMDLVNVNALATVAAIGADKQLLLTGQPTEIIQTHDQAQSLIKLVKSTTGEDITLEQAQQIISSR